MITATLALSIPKASAVAAPLTQLPALGMNVHAMGDEKAVYGQVETALVGADVRWVRSDVGWQSLQPVSGESWDAYQLGQLDAVVNTAHGLGIQLALTFWGTPGWANGGQAKIVPPSDPGGYGRALGFLANRYRGRVAAWEIWNEPNLSHFFTGTDPAQYAGLVKAAYPAVKAADPAALVVAGSVSENDVPWLSRAYDAGIGGNFDVLSTHPYQQPSDQPPDAPSDGTIYQFRHLSAVHDLMVAHGDGAKDIWATEFGWSTHENIGGERNWERGVTEQQQADFLNRAVALARSTFPYVTHMFWYEAVDGAGGSMQNQNFGVLHSDLSAKPALSAIATNSDAGNLPGVSVGDAAVYSTGSTNGLTFTVSVTHPAAFPVVVNWITAPGTANESDYVGAAGVATIPTGTTETLVSVMTRPEFLPDTTERFGLLLTASNVPIDKPGGTGTILTANAGLPTLDANDTSVVQSSTSSRAAVMTITLSGASSSAVSVTYSPLRGTPGFSDCWTAAPRVLTFSPGQTSKRIYLGIRPDPVREGREWFALKLSSPRGATLGRSRAIVAISQP